MLKKPFVVNLQNKVMNFNPPKTICNHLLGPEHTISHRLVVGVGVIVFGVALAEVGTGAVHFTCNCIGFFIHAVGSMPFIELLEKWRKSE